MAATTVYNKDLYVDLGVDKDASTIMIRKADALKKPPLQVNILICIITLQFLPLSPHRYYGADEAKKSSHANLFNSAAEAYFVLKNVSKRWQYNAIDNVKRVNATG